MINKIIRVFPRRTKWTPTDKLSFIGWPPLFRPPDLPVKISCVFTWDIPVCKSLLRAWSDYYSDCSLGGPAFDDPGESFSPGEFIKEGVVFTSRGCIRKCPLCFVPRREGRIRELEITPGWIIQDNNLLACSEKHIRAVFDMLREQKRGITFSGGLDVRLVKDWHRSLFDSIKIKELFFACDKVDRIKDLKKVAGIFDGIPPRKRRCYAMIGFNGESILDAEKRLEEIYSLGFYPFAALYQKSEKKEYSKEWRALVEKWSRPAAFKATNKKRREYDTIE